MAYKYCVATNWGKDFFTARERMEFHLSEHPGNVWVVGDNLYGNVWIKRNNGVIKTKEDAQAIVDSEITKAQAEYDALPADEQEHKGRPENEVLI